MDISKKKKKVITFDGTEEFAVDCKSVNKKYYKRGDRNVEGSGQIFFIEEEKANGAWYRIDTGYLLYDHTVKKYVLKSKVTGHIQKGVVYISEDGKTIKEGYFTTPKTPGGIHLVRIFTNKRELKYCINEKIVKYNRHYIEDLASGDFHHKSKLPAFYSVIPTYCDHDYKLSLPYNSSGNLKHAMRTHDLLYKPTISNIVKEFSKQLEDLTFGLEFESIAGTVPHRICETLGLLPLRDGSIGGLEYATIPLKGDRGVQALIDSLGELKKRTTYDENCSVHIHYGGIPRTTSYIIALFKILYLLQEEMYDMFPFYKFKNCNVKRKHYTKALPLAAMWKLDKTINTDNINKNFNYIFRFFSMGNGFGNYDYDLRNVDCHPADPSGEHKWNIQSRYFWVNFIPLIFGNKKTVEFRMHTSTYCPNKIIYYLVLCGGILNYVKKNEKAILENDRLFAGLTLGDVIVPMKSENNIVYNTINNYIASRKKFKRSSVKKGNFLMNEDSFNNYSKNVNFITGQVKGIPTLIKRRNSYMGFPSSHSKKVNILTGTDEGYVNVTPAQISEAMEEISKSKEEESKHTHINEIRHWHKEMIQQQVSNFKSTNPTKKVYDIKKSPVEIEYKEEKELKLYDNAFHTGISNNKFDKITYVDSISDVEKSFVFGTKKIVEQIKEENEKTKSK